METFTLSWPWLLVLAVGPALLTAFLMRLYYTSRLTDEQLDKHIDLEAYQAQRNIELEILRDRLDEESKAHLRTIQLLTRSRDHAHTPDPAHALQEVLRLKEGEEKEKS